MVRLEAQDALLRGRRGFESRTTRLPSEVIRYNSAGRIVGVAAAPASLEFDSREFVVSQT